MPENYEDGPLPVLLCDAARPRSRLTPIYKPSEAKVASPNLLPLSYRSLCRHGVRSNGKDNQPGALTGKDPVIQTDFAFMSHLLSSRGSLGVAPSKSCSTYAATSAKSFVLAAWRTHCFLQCEKETSSMAIAKSAGRELGGLALRNHRLIVHSHLGVDERLQQPAFVHVRAFKLQLEQDYTTKLRRGDALTPWMVRHATLCLNRYVIHSDGMTYCQRRWEKTFKQPRCEFDETILFRIPMPKSQRDTFESSWCEGLWLGRYVSSDEVLAGTSTGVCKVRSVRRLPASSKLNKRPPDSFQTVPWNGRNDGIL